MLFSEGLGRGDYLRAGGGACRTGREVLGHGRAGDRDGAVRIQVFFGTAMTSAGWEYVLSCHEMNPRS